MRVIDVNLLLYAYDERTALHERAKTWVHREFGDVEPTGLTLGVVTGFIRIATHRRLLALPFTIVEACAIVDEWLALPTVHLLEPTPRHWRLFVETAVRSRAHGKLVPDADLAVSALEHGASLCTHDRDFSRFEGLRVEFPLA